PGFALAQRRTVAIRRARQHRKAYIRFTAHTGRVPANARGASDEVYRAAAPPQSRLAHRLPADHHRMRSLGGADGLPLVWKLRRLVTDMQNRSTRGAWPCG